MDSPTIRSVAERAEALPKAIKGADPWLQSTLAAAVEANRKAFFADFIADPTKLVELLAKWSAQIDVIESLAVTTPTHTPQNG